MGYTSTTAQLFTVPPNMAAFVTVLVTAYYSDKLKNRGFFIIGGAIVGVCGYIMLLVAKTNAVRYAGTFLVAIGVFQGSPMIMVRVILQQTRRRHNPCRTLRRLCRLFTIFIN
jgi:sugar phosphate permease